MRLQAEAFDHGHVTLRHPLEGSIPNAAPGEFAPTGFLPSRSAPFEGVPICAPGLAFVMAAFTVAGGRAGDLSRRTALPSGVRLAGLPLREARRGRLTGATWAILLACSPIFLYQAVQPMSDVPATATWMATLVALSAVEDATRGPEIVTRGREIAAGIAASRAILIRPNIAVAILPLVLRLRDRGAWIRFGLSVLPGLALLRLAEPRVTDRRSCPVMARPARFSLSLAGQRLGALDWRPRVEIRGPVRVRFYDVRARAAYFARR